MKTHFTLFALLLTAGIYAQSGKLQQLESRLSTLHGTAKINALNELAWSYRRLAPGKAQTFAGEAEQLSNRAHYPTGLAYAHKNLGFLHSLRGENKPAGQYLSRSLQEFHRLHNQTEEGNIENLLGLHYWEKGDYTEAIRHYRLADSLFAAARDGEGQEIVLANLGIIYYERAQYDTALIYYTEALKKAIVRNDPLTLSNLYANIGLVYHDTGNFPKAIDYHRRSLVLDNRVNNLSGKAKSFTNLAECYFELRQYDEALDYTKRGLELYAKTGETKGVERSNLNLAHIESRQGNIAGAKTAVRNALRTADAIDDKKGMLMSLSLLGSIQIDAGEYADAINSLHKASAIASALRSSHYESAIALLLAKAYEKLGDGNQALAYYHQSVAFNAAQSDMQAENKLAALEIFLETRTLKEKIDRLQAKNASTAQKKKIAVGAGLVLTFLIVLIYFSQRARYTRKRNRMELQLLQERSQRKALAHNVSEIARESEASREELLRFIRTLPEKQEQPLSEGIRKEKTDQSAHLEELEELGNSRILTEDDWQEFRKRFNRLFPHYLSALKEKFPSITTAELRLAALLKLQLSSREISSMLGISSESVKKLRQRLRKKLSLSVPDSLETFLETV